MTGLRTSRRLVLAATVIGSIVLPGCSIATKQARAAAIIHAADQTLGQPGVTGTVSVDVVPIPPRRPLPPGPGLIQPIGAQSLPFVVDPGTEQAAVLGSNGQPLMLFTSKVLYQRRGDPSAVSNLSGLSGSLDNPTNIVALDANSSSPQKAGQGLQFGGLSASAQAAMAVQSRSSQSSGIGDRPWLKFDYSSISLNQRGGQVAGSYALSPWLVLELARGVLTGSVEPVSTGTGRIPLPAIGPQATLYKVNFGLGKATKHLSSSEQQVVARVMAANAIGGTVFPGYVWLTPDHRLGGLVVEFKQSLSSDEQAVLGITVAMSGPAATSFPARPDPAQVVTVASLGSLVHAVAGR
jgi:hypothetical protein